MDRGDDACDAAAALGRYRRLLEADRPYAAHEALEAAWRSPTGLLSGDEVARALIQWAAAYVHRSRGHPEGARILRTRAQARLASVVADTAVRARWALLGVDLATLTARVQGWPEDPLVWPPAADVLRASEMRGPISPDPSAQRN